MYYNLETIFGRGGTRKKKGQQFRGLGPGNLLPQNPGDSLTSRVHTLPERLSFFRKFSLPSIRIPFLASFEDMSLH